MTHIKRLAGFFSALVLTLSALSCADGTSQSPVAPSQTAVAPRALQAFDAKELDLAETTDVVDDLAAENAAAKPLTPTVVVKGTWQGTFQSSTTGACQWTGGSLNSPAITLVLRQTGRNVTGTIATNLRPTDSSSFACPTFTGWNMGVVNGLLSGNVLTFLDSGGRSTWKLSFTGMSGIGGTASGPVTNRNNFFLRGSVKLAKRGL